MALLLDIVSWVLLLAGSAVILIGSYGLLRLPDMFTRLHGAGMTDTMGAGLLILGMLAQTTDWLVAVKLILILLFLGLTSPTTSHALARAALHDGTEPWTAAAKPATEPSKETVP